MPALCVVYTRSHSAASVVIRAGAWFGPWSHCAVIDGDHAIECLALPPLHQVDGSWRRKLKGEIVRTPLAVVIARASQHDVVDIECPHPEIGIEWARSTLGSRYDHGGVFAIPFRKPTLQREHLGYCSEHVEVAAHKSGANRWRDGMAGVSPSQSYFNAGS